MIRGVIIGKFLPPHKGHSHLINIASSYCDKVYVIVCDKKSQPISGVLRKKWLQEIHPNVEVLVIDDILPWDDSKLWAENTLKWLGFVPELVLTSEDYGESYAKFMGSVHILVDKDRKIVPCSGTIIRENPFKYWNYMEPCVRSYFVKKICIIGAESTGKTTLAQNLAKHFNTIWVPEYGREYSEKKLSNINNTYWETNEFIHIAKEQNKAEEELLKKANKLLICDTDSFATAIWHWRYLGHRSLEVEKITDQKTCDLYLLADVKGAPFVQDGTRDGEHIREWMHNAFVQRLSETKRPFKIITGNWEDRDIQAVTFIKEVFGNL